MEEGDIVVLFLVQDLGAFYGQFPGAGEVVGQLGGTERTSRSELTWR